MVGELVRRTRVARGLTQADLALKSGLRQTYISQVEQGEIAMPRDHNLDALGDALGLKRPDFYRAAGYLEAVVDAGDGSGVVVRGPAGDLAVPIERVVAYVESFPDQRHQDRLARWREGYDTATYQRLCARVFVAWTSNFNLFLDALEVAEIK